MPTHDWNALLTQWSRDLLSSDLAPIFPAEARASGWLGRPGATEVEIAAAEARLGRSLPPSHRAFLQVSNGWPTVIPLLGRLWGAGELAWFAQRRPEWIDDWLLGSELFGEPEPVPDEQYFVYGDAQDSVWIRPEYLRSALEISDLDERDAAIYLLNPEIVTPDGEWEAWYFASWLPGATRYRSFWEMMQAEYQRFRGAMADLEDLAPEFVAYARESLFPAPDLAESQVDLAGLVDALQCEAARWRVRGSETPGRTSTPLYNRSVAEAVEAALEQVQAIRAGKRDPAAQLQQLRALVRDLEGRGRQGTRDAMKQMDAKWWLQAMLRGTIDESIQSAGGPVGCRTAAGIIRSFLER